MAIIHFLNVLEGDCNIIQHDNSHTTIIDVSNAYDQEDTKAELAVKSSLTRALMKSNTGVPKDKKDYGEKKTPDNPIDYLNKLKIETIFRFIITHPDMDHLDGIKDLFSSFSVINIWDTDNKKEILDFQSGGYNKEDWEFYEKIRSGDTDGKTRLTNFAGELRDFWKDDHIHILAPTKELLKDANECGDYNDSSYVLLFTPPKKGGGVWKLLFAGDSHDKTWEYILGDDTLSALVSNVDVLFAPHHGRDSDRSFKFLDTVKPKLTLFGNASSKHLAYNKYPKVRITNNQAGYVVLNVQLDRIDILVKNQKFAQDFRNNHGRNWGDTNYDPALDAYYLGALVAK